MGASVGVDAEQQINATSSNAEKKSYAVSSGLTCPTGDEAVQDFLVDAIELAPLPAPWALHRSCKGEYFFVNSRTGAASWSHPLEPCLRELADVFRKCLELPSEDREQLIQDIHDKWEADARGEYLKWHSVEDASGQTYYCHRETGEAMWDHPAEVLLPGFYLRLASIKLLRSDHYIPRITSRPNTAEEAAPTSSSRLCRKRRRIESQEPPKSAHSAETEAYFIGDPEGDSDVEHRSHLTIDIPDDYDFSSARLSAVCDKESDQLSTRSTEAFFIGDSDDEFTDLEDEPWEHIIDVADAGWDSL